MNLPKQYKRHTSDRAVARWASDQNRPFYRGRYEGVRKRLKGKIALLQVPLFSHTPIAFVEGRGRVSVMEMSTAADPVPVVMAQFNDMTQPEAFGWSAFKVSDFVLVP